MKPDLILHYDKATMRQAAEAAADGHASVYLRMLNGEDDMAISDALLQFDGAGRAHLNNTASEVVKMCRAVDRFEGLVVDGAEIAKLDADSYKRLPRWMIIKMRLATNLEDADGGKDQALPE